VIGTGIFGGERGFELLAQLAVISVLGAGMMWLIRRSPQVGLWRRLPDIVFFVTLVAQLAFLFELSLRPLEIDIDSSAHAKALASQPTLQDVVANRSYWELGKPLQGPLVHALRVAFGLDPLAAYRLLNFASAFGIALLLRSGAARLGAGVWPSVFAGLFSVFCFGPAWLVLDLDDNVPSSLFQWAFVFALLRGLPGLRGTPARRLEILTAGLVFGIAISFHRKALLWGALFPLVPMVSARFRNASVLRPLCAAGLLAGALYLLASFLFLQTGFSVRTLADISWSPHHENPAWWFFSSDVTVATQIGSIWNGWRATLVGFPLVFTLTLGSSPLWFPDAFILLFVGVGVASVWLTRHDPSVRLLSLGVGLQVAHSFCFTPAEAERWDMAALGIGVLASVAVSSSDGSRAVFRAATAWLFLMLATLQHLSVGLYIEAGEIAERLRHSSVQGIEWDGSRAASRTPAEEAVAQDQ
jgi:hypothetical protein